MLRNSKDKIVGIAAVVIGHLPLALIGLVYAGFPKIESVNYIIASVISHFFYQYFLFNAYRYGELSFVYPIARGLSPMLLTISSLFYLQENLQENEIMGVILISFSIIIVGISNSLKFKIDFKALLFAIATGIFISLYSIADGLGARVNNDALSYYSTMTIINGIIFSIFIIVFHPQKFKKIFNEGKYVFIIGGSASYIAYLIVVWACLTSPIPVVSSLRECSVFFALILGVLFLKEKFSYLKITMTSGIFLGILLMKFN